MHAQSDKSADFGNGNGLGVPASTPLPLRREHYLHRVGPVATLMTVEWLTDADGRLRTQMRFAFWPGL
jgi:hypothetical protein